MKILTGMGRSGTSFISKMINDCTEKKSRHESIKRSLNKKLVPEINDEYIEVNSFCRYDMHLQYAHFTLLLRSPIEICLSISKRYEPKKRSSVIREMVEWYAYLQNNICFADNVFFFDRYTKEPEYLYNLLNSIGCKEVNMDALKSEMVFKVNYSKSKSKTLDEVYTQEEIFLINEMEKEYGRYKNIYNR